jgi:hypothetical protein
VAASIEAGSLIDLNFSLPRRQFFALHHRERSITQAERELFKLIDAVSKPSGRRSADPARRRPSILIDPVD